LDRNSHARAPDAQLNLAWWLDQLVACTGADGVMKIVREFVGAWPAEKLQALPPQCRPDRLETADQIGELAYCLARAQLSGAHDAPHIHALAMFFTSASEKLSRLAVSIPPDAPRLFLPR
jgi:hypothetical protein